MPYKAAGGVKESRVRPPRVARVGGDAGSIFFLDAFFLDAFLVVSVWGVANKEEEEGGGGELAELASLARTNVSTRP